MNKQQPQQQKQQQPSNKPQVPPKQSNDNKQKPSKRILIVLTSYHESIKGNGPRTGAYFSELAHPYMYWKSKGYEMDFTSPRGGAVAFDESSLKALDCCMLDLLNDETFQFKIKNTIACEQIANTDLKQYHAIFVVGGHGAAFDLPGNTAVQTLVQKVYSNGGIVSAVCHGPCAFINVKIGADYMVKGKRITCFSNKEDDLFGIREEERLVPVLPEKALRERGAVFGAAPVPFGEHVEIDGKLITGQNPASAEATARAVDKLMATM